MRSDKSSHLSMCDACSFSNRQVLNKCSCFLIEVMQEVIEVDNIKFLMRNWTNKQHKAEMLNVVN